MPQPRAELRSPQLLVHAQEPAPPGTITDGMQPRAVPGIRIEAGPRVGVHVAPRLLAGNGPWPRERRRRLDESCRAHAVPSGTQRRMSLTRCVEMTRRERGGDTLAGGIARSEPEDVRLAALTARGLRVEHVAQESPPPAA